MASFKFKRSFFSNIYGKRFRCTCPQKDESPQVYKKLARQYVSKNLQHHIKIVIFVPFRIFYTCLTFLIADKNVFGSFVSIFSITRRISYPKVRQNIFSKRNMFKLVLLSIVFLCPKVYFIEVLLQLYDIDDT